MIQILDKRLLYLSVKISVIFKGNTDVKQRRILIEQQMPWASFKKILDLIILPTYRCAVHTYGHVTESQ